MFNSLMDRAIIIIVALNLVFEELEVNSRHPQINLISRCLNAREVTRELCQNVLI